MLLKSGDRHISTVSSRLAKISPPSFPEPDGRRVSGGGRMFSVFRSVGRAPGATKEQGPVLTVSDHGRALASNAARMATFRRSGSRLDVLAGTWIVGCFAMNRLCCPGGQSRGPEVCAISLERMHIINLVIVPLARAI